MTALAALPTLRLPLASRQRRSRWSVALSVLLHLALLALVIVAAQHRRRLPEPVPPASMAMVFESGGRAPPSLPTPSPATPGHPGAPQPQQAAPPPPPPAAAVPPPAQPPAPAPPAEPAPAPQEQLEPAPPLPAPPMLQAAPQTPARPAPPPAAAPTQQAPAPEVAPLPPPVTIPLPAPPAPPPPAPQRPPRPLEAHPTAPPRAAPAFPAPMDFSLGSRSAEVPSTPRQRTAPGMVDLSYSPRLGSGDITQLHPEGKGDDVGPDWFNEVAAWWLRHRFYPNEAARLDQEGEVTLRLVVRQSGHVQGIDVERRSGSPFLDMGALAVFRNANLPPLPPDVRDPNVTVDFTIHYEIIR